MTHLASTVATEQHCPRCRAPVLVALDEGLTARVDHAPTNHAGEIAALLDGRWTYTLTTWRHLVHRDATRIAARYPHGTIHTEHKCTRNIQGTIDDLIGDTK